MPNNKIEATGNKLGGFSEAGCPLGLSYFVRWQTINSEVKKNISARRNMKEFMFNIRNSGDAKASLSASDHLSFIKKCEVYIDKLKAEGKLVAAQPIIREGLVVSKSSGNWTKDIIDPTKEVRVGYYHIKANDIEEAIEIAKANPEFEYVPSAKIEIHQIKTKEERTGFVYPK
jgi:hypothetical protein